MFVLMGTLSIFLFSFRLLGLIQSINSLASVLSSGIVAGTTTSGM